ncbi:Os12g0565133 [Oryza sativa Japonica Group]|uniref:Os12g0565133 protein n=1 Tax=Oryza sativa subsp. japonica TaxID=39947 RepID=A0A0P0YBI8_ORYSJ|nr:hypothetical protein EE612_060316 [Oryza sativa]BAT17684.1 Os12g0565133 [Oryza sativa Japonica Group]
MICTSSFTIFSSSQVRTSTAGWHGRRSAECLMASSSASTSRSVAPPQTISTMRCLREARCWMPKSRTLPPASNETRSISTFAIAPASNISPSQFLQQVKWNSFRHTNMLLLMTSLSLGPASFDISHRNIRTGKSPRICITFSSTRSMLISKQVRLSSDAIQDGTLGK